MQLDPRTNHHRGALSPYQTTANPRFKEKPPNLGEKTPNLGINPNLRITPNLRKTLSWF